MKQSYPKDNGHRNHGLCIPQKEFFLGHFISEQTSVAEEVDDLT
jgi:hypothetical protein